MGKHLGECLLKAATISATSLTPCIIAKLRCGIALENASSALELLNNSAADFTLHLVKPLSRRRSRSLSANLAGRCRVVAAAAVAAPQSEVLGR